MNIKNLTSALLRKKRKKESWFKYIVSILHLWVGLLTSVIIVIVSLSGSIYVFKDEVTTYVNKDAVYLKEKTEKLASIDTMLSNFYNKFDKNASRIVIPLEKDKNIILQKGKGKKKITAYYHRETGVFIKKANTNSSNFFSWILRLHRWLLVKGVGKTVVGITILLFLLMLLSGLVLWFPTKKKKVKDAFMFKKKSKIGRFIYDLHNVVGFYSTTLLLVMAITGLCFSFKWFRQGTLYVFKSNEDRQIQKIDTERRKQRIQNNKEVSYDAMLAKANEIVTYEAQTIVMLPSKRNPNITIRKNNTNNWLGAQLPDEVAFTQQGKLNNVLFFKDKKLFQQVNKLILPLHTGELCGLPSKIFYFFLALIATSLPITGFLIWWRKSKAKVLSN